MSMKKAFDQTIRDIKREVNKKVLKVPSIEQKVLDATSNEPWGPHGSLLADIAQATRNYHEYQMIISVIWKRINDTGKNWRHVYKALTVLEYLVAHGSERVIDEIKEHAYQISTLSDFQYIDSSGRDQGNNVRRKSQSLVLLVNDKERILEVRQKAAANREKFRSTSAVGGMYRPSSYSGSGGYGDRYDDDRYVGRDDERNGYGREREWSSRDDDRYGRYGDSYTRDGDRHSRDSEERYGKDSYRDDEYRSRSPKVDDYQYGSRSRSADKDKDHSYDDDDRQSSRGSSVKGEDHPQDGRRVERKFPEQNVGAPPSYEEAVGGSRSPAYSERDGDAPAASAPKSSSPPTSASPSQNTASWSPVNPEADTFDAFDPRGPVTGSSAVAGAAPVASGNAEMDLFGSLSDSFSSNPLAVVPVTSAPVTAGINSSNTADINSVPFTGNQSFEDPFGDSPFKAISSSDEIPAQTHNLASPSVLQPTSSIEQTHPVAQKVETVSNLDFSDTFPGLTYYTTDIPNSQQSLLNSHSTPQEPLPNQNDDILAGILPPPEPSLQTASQSAYHAPAGQPAQPNYGNISNYIPQSGPAANYGPQSGPEINYMQQSVPAAAGVSPMASQNPAMSSAQLSNSLPQPVSGSAVSSNINRTQSYAVHQQNNDFLDSYSSQAGESITLSSQPVRSSSTGSLALVTQQPAKDKFEPKSAVWADTLNRGLVNLNISGAKVNPLSDIGIDFEALNRKEKRMEKPSAAPSTSNIPMGKAMGSGSGIGRAGVGAHRAPLNPMMGGMGRGGGPSMGMGMGGYGGMNQSMGMGTGGYGGQNPSMGLGTGGYGGMHMGMGPGAPMQSASGYPPAANMPSGYNPMLGRGGYPPQQPYGGGYQ